jgi:hypothetical protein
MSIPEESLWRIARRRAAFKRHLTAYVLINLFLWAVWWFTTESRGINTGPIPWPIWSTLGWGLGLAFNYFAAYGDLNGPGSVEREYHKLKEEQEKKYK